MDGEREFGPDSLQEAGFVDIRYHQLTLKYLDHQLRLIWEMESASDCVVVGLWRVPSFPGCFLCSYLVLVMSSESPQEEKPQLPNKKSDELQAKKDRSLAEFLLMLDDFKPLVGDTFCAFGIDQCSLSIISITQIPGEVTDYYLQRNGFDCEDERL